tara:strand:+ start:447 stop:809 length:363 start_codon:yes stop_codon:yes gene_type:complete
MGSNPNNTEETYYDETSLIRHRLITRMLVEMNLLMQVGCYVWMILPPKDTDELALKIVIVGFPAPFVFVFLCIKSFFRQRAYRAQWTSFDHALYRMNFLLASYPVLMAALIYIMAGLYPE